ncbi:radical SAM family heme chaperone HemW [Mangrovimonas sp. YM274]|uniref:radical SAM family heme chaperone HemW n=1 Tax=Mangrovimonas sp. YM274 TaxID=3070660 RepID=UPI0027DD89A0|nr:radical SAM family heme chaperone HemW [Mangrovimonas sp. YM274]WMI68579.1 radical SAM family heme chaperone HemW [Mangrovimonas sp. YM274]
MSGIYFHIPFCKQACYYCDFHFSTSLKKKDALLQCLTKELQLRHDEFQNEMVETIYFGGGTPSLLTVEELQLLINAVYGNFKVAESPEITLEANPDDLTPEKIEALAASRINRLSIGIQSFFDEDLKGMNRAHNAYEAKQALELAAQLFDNITIDLIYGIPNMDLKKWDQNLQMAFDFGVQHISSYALTVEPKTALDSFVKKGTYPPVDEALALEHFNHLMERTTAEGFVHYEISNFGKPGFYSKHNTSYWQGKPYLGIGPSAHSFNAKRRSWNVPNNSAYIKAIIESELPSTVEELSVEDQYNEYVMTGLRTIWGVSLDKIESDFGANFKEYILKAAKPHLENGVLAFSKGDEASLCTTSKGKFLADGIASDLFFVS